MVRSILKQMIVVCGFLSCLQVTSEAKAYYASHQGRFINRDPIGYVDGQNLYAGYFAPDGMDPDGLQGHGMPRRPPADPFPENDKGELCGYSIWLLTGNWCALPDVIIDAADAHDVYTGCFINCEYSEHTKVMTYVEGALVDTAYFSLERVPIIAKSAEELAKGSMGGKLPRTHTSVFSRLAHEMKNSSYKKSGQWLRNHQRFVKTQPIKSGCIAGIAIFETYVSLKCWWKCG